MASAATRTTPRRGSSAAAGGRQHHLKPTTLFAAAADADDIEVEHPDQGLMRRTRQGRTQHTDQQHNDNDSSSSSSDDEDEDAGASSEAEDSLSEEEDGGRRSTQFTTTSIAAARASSHAAASPGPSSAAAAAGGGGKTARKKAATATNANANSKQKKGAVGSNSKKRPAGVAFQDAISLLPADLDVETLVRIRQQLQPRNRMQKQALLQSYRQQYQHWRFLLRQRFSLVFYGFGSKRQLLEGFAQESLTDGGVLACDGLAAGLNAKQVLQAVASALTHRSCKSHSHSELLSLIVAEPPCRQLYLVLHNIDGPGLRSAEEQLWLSRLSQAPCIRLVASVDHVNAALLWNSRVAAAFNWLWVEGTTYAGYDAETCNVAPIITSCKQSATKRGATTVLSTLVTTAREVFKVLAAQQLEAGPAAAGVSFPLLLRIAREKFIVNSEHALKSVLTEFRDHELIKLRPGPDGGEVMYVPMEPDMLRGALQEMQAADEAAAA